MTRAIVLWVAGILLVAAVVARILTTNVYGDRGRDEIDLFSIHKISVDSGAVVTQQVPLQRADAYAIQLPYQWLGSRPARIEVSFTTPDGSLLSSTTHTLPNSRAPFWLRPTGDGSLLDDESAAIDVIRLPSAAVGTVVLTLTRLDRESGTLMLFASTRPSPPAGPDVGSQADMRPTMLERPTEFLVLETEYDVPRPAVAKTPVYVSRVQSLAPPWLPFPLPELLLACLVVTGVFLYTRTLYPPKED